MTALTLKERLRKAATSVDPVKRSAIMTALATPLKRLTEAGTPVDHLLIVPQDLRTADPSFWHELQHGQVGLAGSMATLRGESPFTVDAPSIAWARELHGFGWLRDLEAVDTDDARDAGRRLALEWSIRFENRPGVWAEPQVAAQRLISWLSHADFLLEEADKQTYAAITFSLGRQLSHLLRTWKEATPGYPRLVSLIGLMMATLSLAGHDRQSRTIEVPFAAELAAQILSDGGHVSRNPAVIVELLLDLLPLSQCFTARERPLPQQFGEALERMLPMARHLRLGDGCLARFNGVGCATAASLSTVVAYDDGSLPPVSAIGASGYARMERGGTIIVADVGGPPPLAFSSRAQAGCLSFEMSAGSETLFVNGGFPGSACAEWVPAARASASHNSLVLAEKSSSRLIAHRKLEAMMGFPPLRYPDRVEHQQKEGEDALVMEASHDGYFRRYELIHTRRLELSNDGNRLSGTDRLDGRSAKVRLRADLPYAIHFHLAPGAKCGLGNHNEALVTLPSGQQWRLTAQGVDLYVEESAYFAESAGPRRTAQIVLRGATFGEAEVTWQVERVGADEAA